MAIKYLQVVSNLNGLVKQVLLTSASLRMISLNAMLCAKKSDTHSAGFASVTLELRRFSHQLSGVMESLFVNNGVVIRALADLLAFQNQMRLYARALGYAVDWLEQTEAERLLLDKHHSHSQARQETLLTLDNLIRDIKRLTQICQVGTNLAVLAKIESEAAVGGSDALRVISADISGAVARVSELVTEIDDLSAILHSIVRSGGQAEEQQYTAN